MVTGLSHCMRTAPTAQLVLTRTRLPTVCSLSLDPDAILIYINETSFAMRGLDRRDRVLSGARWRFVCPETHARAQQRHSCNRIEIHAFLILSGISISVLLHWLQCPEKSRLL